MNADDSYYLTPRIYSEHITIDLSKAQSFWGGCYGLGQHEAAHAVEARTAVQNGQPVPNNLSESFADSFVG